MSTKEYKDCCKGCDISREFEKKLGGIIELDGDWILNHYEGGEGFLGWLALQPRFHRMEFTDLSVDEINAFGKNIQNIDISLRQYWAVRFPEDPIEKVYVVYFFESKGYHLHIHLIPRTMELGQGDPQVYMAWKTSERTAREDFPKKYRLRNKESKKNEIEINKHEVVALMTYLKGCLWKLSTN